MDKFLLEILQIIFLKYFHKSPAFVDFDKVVKGIDQVKHVNYNVIKMGGIEKKSCKKGIVINVMWQF